MTDLEHRVMRLERQLATSRRRGALWLAVAIAAVATTCKAAAPTELTFGDVHLDANGLSIGDAGHGTTLSVTGLEVHENGQAARLKPELLQLGTPAEPHVTLRDDKDFALLSLKRGGQRMDLRVDGNNGPLGKAADLSLYANHTTINLVARAEEAAKVGYGALRLMAQDSETRELSTSSGSAANAGSGAK